MAFPDYHHNGFTTTFGHGTHNIRLTACRKSISCQKAIMMIIGLSSESWKDFLLFTNCEVVI